MNTLKKLFSNRLFLLGLVVTVFILVLGGFTIWYVDSTDNLYSKEETVATVTSNESSTASTSSSSVNIDKDVSEIDQEVNSISDDDFSDNELNDSKLGL